MRVFDPQTRERANGKPRVLICDGFGTHETLEILEHCFANNILLCRLPSHTSHKLQPCDIAAFAPLKAAYRDNVERMERGGVNTIGKQHFTSLYSPARDASFTRRNIIAGLSKGGLFPFDPQRVLRDMQKPFDAIGSTTANVGDFVPRVQQVTVPVLTMPVTPVTPVSAEAFMSLQDLIIQQDAHALEDVDRQRLERHLQKLTKGAQTSIVKGTLQEDRIQFLLKANNEAQSRRSTKSLVLGKAKVMSFEDLEEARKKRAENEVNRVAKKRTRGRERKDGSPKARGPETITGAVRTDELIELARTPVQVAETEGVGDLIIPESGRAPVARMW